MKSANSPAVIEPVECRSEGRLTDLLLHEATRHEVGEGDAAAVVVVHRPEDFFGLSTSWRTHIPTGSHARTHNQTGIQAYRHTGRRYLRGWEIGVSIEETSIQSKARYLSQGKDSQVKPSQVKSSPHGR